MKRRAIAIATLLTTSVAWAAGPTTATTPPATTQAARPRRPATTAASQATVDRDAQPLLSKLAAFYARPGPLRVEGTMTGRFDVAGRAKDYSQKVIGQIDDAGRFRHDADPAGLLINTGKAAYLYDRKRDAFAELTTAPGRQSVEAISPTFIGILIDENPALLLKHASDPEALLRQCARAIRVAKSSATQPSDIKASSGLVLEQQDRVQTLWLGDGGEIIAATIDYTPLMRARKAKGIKAAEVTLVYQASEETPPAADAFAWRPPATAMQFDAEPPPDLLQSATQPAGAATRPARRGR